ncbi:MAG: SIS domain-containing protein [Clostridiales bacterium]|nr:SIS domain-containing protein [Clostridiales bacterium]
MDYKQTSTWKEINETPKIIGGIHAENSAVMKELVKAVKHSKITNFVAAARGSSNHAITYFKYLLEVMSNYTVGLSAPSIVTLYRGKINYSNSIVIGCSQSGMAEDVLEVIKKGNDQGAITIAVTNNIDSPIAKLAKFHLYCNAGEEVSFIATKSFSAELYLLLWLAAELSGLKNDVFFLKHLKYDIEQVLPQIDKMTDKYAEKFKDMQGGFVLSRGLTYPIALETALLMQETCYMQFKGYAGSDFYHGPMAAVGAHTPIIIFCAKNDGDEEIQSIIRADQIKCVEKVLSLSAPVLLVTNDMMLTGRFKRCNDVLLDFNVPEEFAIFAFALFAQMLACKMSCLIGNNPDTPRAIEKTTITK